MKTMVEEWKEYVDRVYGGSFTCENQEEQIRQAFFSGALVTCGKIGEVSNDLKEGDSEVKFIEAATKLKSVILEVTRECLKIAMKRKQEEQRRN